MCSMKYPREEQVPKNLNNKTQNQLFFNSISQIAKDGIKSEIDEHWVTKKKISLGS